MRMRPALVLGLLAAPLCAAAVAAPGAAAAPEPTVTLTPLGTYHTGAFDEGASEITTYDPATKRVFVVNAQAGTVDVLDISDPTNPVKVGSLETPGANSVAVSKGLIAVAQQADTKTDPGVVTFFDGATLAQRGQVGVGSLPDMVTFTPNGRYALVANEGEPDSYCADGVDPEGSVSIIDLLRGPARATVRTATFTAYNSQADALRAKGVRIFGPGASVAQDLEPEYIATNAYSSRAWVSLQENNAFAVIDIHNAKVLGIRPLGLKDHSQSANALDASDRDKVANIRTWPVKGMYMPDAIARYAAGGSTFLVTANEGDARDYDCFAEEARVKSLTLDPAAFPDAAALQNDLAMGRLNVTTTSPSGPNGYTELYSFGGRSISVRNAATGALMWDSGSAIEEYIAANRPDLYNADHAENGIDSRSDNKGPEPEGLDVARLGNRTYAFTGLERESGIVVFDITNPRAGRIAGYADNRDAAGDPEAGTAGDLGPEGIKFVPGVDSPNGRPLLIVGNEVSGTTTIWQVAVGTSSQDS